MASPSHRLRMLSVDAVRRLPVGEEFSFEVSGFSMEPVLRAGDEILAERWEQGRALALGDLAVLSLPDAGLVVHRVLWKGSEQVRTRGDGTGLMDPPIPLEDVLGRVIRVARQGQDVTPSRSRRFLAWCGQFAGAALHRLKRRLFTRTASAR